VIKGASADSGTIRMPASSSARLVRVAMASAPGRVGVHEQRLPGHRDGLAVDSGELVLGHDPDSPVRRPRRHSRSSAPGWVRGSQQAHRWC